MTGELRPELRARRPRAARAFSCSEASMSGHRDKRKGKGGKGCWS
jgi:hypothetical protein